MREEAQKILFDLPSDRSRRLRWASLFTGADCLRKLAAWPKDDLPEIAVAVAHELKPLAERTPRCSADTLISIDAALLVLRRLIPFPYGFLRNTLEIGE